MMETDKKSFFAKSTPKQKEKYQEESDEEMDWESPSLFTLKPTKLHLN